MIITPYSTPHALLKLMLLRSRQGQVIRAGLAWHLTPLEPSSHSVPISVAEALPQLTLMPGHYQVAVTWGGELRCMGELQLSSGTCTDIAYWLPETLAADSDEYFFDYDAAQWFACRSEERVLQSRHGVATLPLRDPNQTPVGEQGIQLQSHPLLRDKVQFDGVPPDIRPEPSQNRMALELTLQQRLAATPSFLPSPTPSR